MSAVTGTPVSTAPRSHPDTVSGPRELGWTRVFPVFAIVGSITYFVYMGLNLAPFAYYPLITEFHAPTPRLPLETSGPPMFWYGWIVYAVLTGAAASLVAYFLPQRWVNLLSTARLSWLSWLVPAAVATVMVYYHWHFFQ